METTMDGPMTREELIPLMGHDLKRDGEWMMRFCPTHPDGLKQKKRSLGLSDNGVLRCFAGCTESKDGFKQVLDALRLEAGVAALNPPSPVIARQPEGNLVDVYDYRSPDGKLVAQKGRFERLDGTKAFKWRTTFEGHTWPGGVKMEEMPLWGAELVANAPPEEWIFFCEGEKAVKAARAAGLFAVCHGGGASYRKFGDSLTVLQNRKIALWPDNDEVGRKFMIAIQQELIRQNIPLAVTTVSVPVPPKGDAHDYFAAGGNKDNVLDGTFAEPKVEVLTKDFIKVTIPTKIGPVAFCFDGLVYETRNLACEFSVEVVMPPQEQYCSRAENILSVSWRETTCRALKNMFGDNDWTMAVNAAIFRARAALIATQKSVQLSADSDDVDDLPAEMPYRIEGVLPEGQVACIFADGESGKTWLSYALGLSVATGHEFLGLKVIPGNVLIIDWETDEEQAKKRLKRLLKAQSIQKMPDSIYYHSGAGMPLYEHVESLRRLVREKNIDMIIIDSGAPAAGTPPEDSRGTIAFFGAVARLGATTLIICHVNRQDATRGSADKPFGSAFWHNLSRRTFFLGYSKPTSEQIDMALICKKTNDGRRPQPLSFKLTFTGMEGIGPALIEPLQFRSVPAFEVYLPPTERIWLILKREGDMMFVDIMKALGWTGDDFAHRLTNVLRWGKENGWFGRISLPSKQVTWEAIGAGPAQK